MNVATANLARLRLDENPNAVVRNGLNPKEYVLEGRVPAALLVHAQPAVSMLEVC